MNNNSKYQSLNVLNYNKISNFITSEEAINQVSSIIDSTGNRKNRRKAEKILSRTVKIQQKAENYANERALSKIEARVDKDFMYLFAIIGITMYEDYHWKETEDNDHGQITSLYERITKKMEKYSTEGYSTEDIIRYLDELTGIQLISSFKQDNS